MSYIVVEKLLWNLTIENKSLSSFKLKEPHNIMANAPLELKQKTTHVELSLCEIPWRVGRDSNPQLLP